MAQPNGQAFDRAAFDGPLSACMKPILLDIVRNRADMSASAIAAELNRRKIETLRPRSRWHAQTVIRIMRRLGMEQTA